jgi:hypothetical protein
MVCGPPAAIRSSALNRKEIEMLGAIGLIGGAVGALGGGGGALGALGALAGGGGALGGLAGGGAFDAALTAARTALGGQDAQIDKMIETGSGVMGGVMMRLAGEVLNAGMEDDGD